MKHARVLGLLIATLGLAALGQTLVRAVHLSYVHAPVEVSPVSGTGTVPAWQKAVPNAPLQEGEQVRTGTDGAVEVELECGSALRLVPNSIFAFVHLRRNAKGVALTTIEVSRGTAFFTVRKNDSQGLQIRVNGADISGWHGMTQLRVDVSPSQRTAVELLGGRAKLLLHGQAYRLPRAAALRWSGADLPVQTSGMPNGPWYQWSQKRDRDFDRLLLDARVKSPMLPMADASYDPSMATMDVPYDPHAAAIFRPPDTGPVNGDTAAQARRSMDRAALKSLDQQPALVPRCAVDE